MLKLFKVIKDIRLYIEYKRIIKKESIDSPIWAKNNLRMDWVGRIYTVINLPPSIIYSEDIPKEARISYITMNEMKAINEYLKGLNLEEILTVNILPIKGTNEESYLIVYQYLFRQLNLLWIFRFLLEIFLIVVTIRNIEYIINLFKWI